MSGESDDDGRSVLMLVGIAIAVLAVLGVVLVVVTVILSAVIGTFVLGIGDQAGTAGPVTSLDFQYQDAGGTLTVTHDGGDSFSASAVEVIVDGETVGTWADFGDPGSVAIGDSIRIDGLQSGDTVRLVWTGVDGERQELGRYTV